MNDNVENNPDSHLHVMPGVSVDQDRVRKPAVKRRSLSVDDHVSGVLAGDRAIIGRTFSLMESSNPAHREKAEEVLERLMPRTGDSIRFGISGVPGVGKSTFIEALGMRLLDYGHRVAVLAVDPSSDVSGGSIMGDKTRMESLSRSPKALIRPTACGTWHGGVARGTRESIIVCEAAGFDVVIVETVGVGQSETQVASMVDFFLLLMLAGAGDELQGIKRGIIELADAIAINKADGENKPRALAARTQYLSALRLLRPNPEGWQPGVVTCSAVSGDGIDEIWRMVKEHREMLIQNGELAMKRDRQALYWLKQSLENMLIDRFYQHSTVVDALPAMRKDVVEGRISPFSAAERLIKLWKSSEVTEPGAPGTPNSAPGATGNS